MIQFNSTFAWHLIYSVEQKQSSTILSLFRQFADLLSDSFPIEKS